MTGYFRPEAGSADKDLTKNVFFLKHFVGQFREKHISLVFQRNTANRFVLEGLMQADNLAGTHLIGAMYER